MAGLARLSAGLVDLVVAASKLTISPSFVAACEVIMKTKLIEIQVHGFTSDGKTNVCSVIRDALIAAYGPHTQVASVVLSQESERLDENRPSFGTIFVIDEYNHGSMIGRCK